MPVLEPDGSCLDEILFQGWEDIQREVGAVGAFEVAELSQQRFLPPVRLPAYRLGPSRGLSGLLMSRTLENTIPVIATANMLIAACLRCLESFCIDFSFNDLLAGTGEFRGFRLCSALSR